MIDGDFEVTKVNAGNGHVHGFEAESEYEIFDGLSLFGWVAWQEGELERRETDGNSLINEPLSRMMPLSAEAGIRWAPPIENLWIELAALGAVRQDRLSERDRQDTQRIPPGSTPGYVIGLLRAGYELREGLNLTFGVENFTDTAYRVHGSGINGPGRNFIFSAEWQFQAAIDSIPALRSFHQPVPENAESVPLRTESVRLDLTSPLRRRSRRFTAALIASLAIHGLALAAVVLNPARFFAFTGDDGGAPGAELLSIALAADPPREDRSEVKTESLIPASRARQKPVQKRPETAGELPSLMVISPAGQPMIDTAEAAPLAFVTLEALAELPPGFEPPARPEPPSVPPSQPPSKVSASKSNTANIPRPGAAGPVTRARIKRQMGIRYPEDARREGVEGFCIVEISINAAGRVTSARVSKSSGDARLDREALRAAKSSTFHAARKGNTAIASRARMPFRFVLR